MSPQPRLACASTLFVLAGTLLFTSSAAYAGSFCDDLIRAISEGKNDFSQLKGNKRTDLPFVEYETSFRFSGLADEGCSIRPDEERATKLSLTCRSNRMDSEPEAKVMYNDLKDELTSCVKMHYPNTWPPRKHPFRPSTFGGFESISIENIAETNLGWRLEAELEFQSSSRAARHGERIPEYYVFVNINSK